MKYITIISMLLLTSCFGISEPPPSEPPGGAERERKKEVENDPIPSELPGHLQDSGLFVLKSPIHGWTNISRKTVFEFSINTSTRFMDSRESYKYISEPQQYVSINDYNLKLKEYKTYDNSIVVQYVIDTNEEIESGPYELTIASNVSSDYKFKFRKDEQLHVAGLSFDHNKADQDNVTATIVFSERVKIEENTQICVENICLNPDYVGTNHESFQIALGAHFNINDPIEVHVSGGLKSAITGENVSIRSWQQDNAKYKRLNQNGDDIAINYINGMNEFDCGQDIYCWGVFR